MMTRHSEARLPALLLLALLLSQPACSDAASSGPGLVQDAGSEPTITPGTSGDDASVIAPTDGTSTAVPPIDDVEPGDDAEPAPDVTETSDVGEDAGQVAQDSATSDVQVTDSQVEVDTASEDATQSGDVATGPEDTTTEDTTTEDTSPADSATEDTSPADTSAATDTVEEDAEADTATTEDADVDPDPVPELPPTAAFNAPASQALIDEGVPITFTALVTAGDAALDTLTWALSSSVDGLMGSGSVSPDGIVELVTSTLSPGPHVVTLNVDTPTLPQAAEATVTLKICAVMTPDDFDADIEASGWKLYGNAYWDAGGWLELTGLQSGGGSIYKISETLSASDTTIQFDFYTGDGIEGGADGFAMTVIDVDSVTELETFIATAKNGGCLGYGASAACGPMEIEAFHVEIDTWYNENYADPTTNHIAITLNGDPSNHVLVADGLILEDSQWHTIEIAVAGTNVNVNLDGINLINGDIPGLTFRGGYIGFSGSTGWATNWHRVDNLTVVQECANL